MSIVQQVRAYFKSERVRNNIFKLCQVGLICGAFYITVNIRKPVGTYGQKKML